MSQRRSRPAPQSATRGRCWRTACLAAAESCATPVQRNISSALCDGLRQGDILHDIYRNKYHGIYRNLSIQKFPTNVLPMPTPCCGQMAHVLASRVRNGDRQPCHAEQSSDSTQQIGTSGTCPGSASRWPCVQATRSRTGSSSCSPAPPLAAARTASRCIGFRHQVGSRPRYCACLLQQGLWN